jgi:hypothetical protein
MRRVRSIQGIMRRVRSILAGNSDQVKRVQV